MPVTARLSGKFYERFGDEITNEPVDWFNAVDATYQAQLKDVNELNWDRMGSRFSAFDARIDGLEAKLNARIDALEFKLNARVDTLESTLNARFEALESSLNGRLEALESTLNARIDAAESKSNARLTDFEGRMDDKLNRQRVQLIGWMFGFWTATVLPIIGVMLAISRV